ncbi:MAG: enoyl-CoA hydratase/isomerase family protein [Alphaproteobacteria bacterium]|nr:enoyl-CoA hydratase/isomerase family protein [Alphaproteobacteria bacterium]
MTELTEPLVLVEQDEHVAYLTFNRPAKKNALNNPLLDQMVAALRAANADDNVHVIVLRGAGGVFSSGRDFSMFDDRAALGDQSVDKSVDVFLEMLSLLMEIPKPTIASIEGLALGGGQATSLACDFVVAERGASFGNVEMAYGFPAAMNTVLLTRHVGRRIGMEIAITGDVYTAEQYHGYGLVNRLAEPGQLAETTREFAALLASRAPWAVQRTKSTYRMAEDMDLTGAMHVGNQLNQLLRLNGQLETVHSGDSSVKDALKSDLKS